jgi:hypothetical protein
MKPSGSKKCSYSGMKKKGLLNDSPSTSDGNTMAYQKLDPKAAQKKAEETSEEKVKKEPVRVSLPNDSSGDVWRVDQTGDVRKAQAASSNRYNSTDEGKRNWESFQGSIIGEGTKPDIKGNYGVLNKDTGLASSWNKTTKKASEAAKQAYYDGFNKFRTTDKEYQRQREILKRGIVGDAITEDPDLL